MLVHHVLDILVDLVEAQEDALLLLLQEVAVEVAVGILEGDGGQVVAATSALGFVDGLFGCGGVFFLFVILLLAWDYYYWFIFLYLCLFLDDGFLLLLLFLLLLFKILLLL